MGFHDVLMNRSVSTEDDRGLTSYINGALALSCTKKSEVLMCDAYAELNVVLSSLSQLL
jgi:hypothetical protein